MHEAIKQAIGFDGLANCENCPYIEDVSDGWEYGQGPWWICGKKGRQHVSNLKSFPFKAEQKCWEPDFWRSRFPDMIKNGEDEDVGVACTAYREALQAAKK